MYGDLKRFDEWQELKSSIDELELGVQENQDG